jgi:hypothetical protein
LGDNLSFGEQEEAVNLRTFRPGDEAVQAAIYNEAAARLPKFKPATVDEVRRRTQAADFDPEMRFFAEVAGQPVAYCLYNANGRVSYPWCRPGYEDLAEPLFTHVLSAMQQRGFSLAFAAYRADWSEVTRFFLEHGFQLARQMINFVLEVADLPTLPARPSYTVTPLQREDIPALFALAPQVLRVRQPEELEEHLWHNPYFSPEAVFVLRPRGGAAPLAAGIFITTPHYADPLQLDADMPCFRLGAFGTERMQSKRVRGLFSFLARADSQANLLGVELLGQAALWAQGRSDLNAFAAQVPSDAPHLLRFYQHLFRRQGAFPVFERVLTSSSSR